MTYDYKKWIKDDVERLLQDIDYEAAKKHTYAFNYYFDENDKLRQVEIAIFVVMEWVREDKDHNIKSSTVRGTKRMGGFWVGYSARMDRDEYGDVGEHSLISEQEAKETLEKNGPEF